MITVWCSDYLRRQQLANDDSARALLAALPAAPGCGARLVGLFAPSVRREVKATRQKRATLLDQAAAHERDAENWAKGSDGEDFLAETLADQFGDEYTLLRNYTPPAPWAIGGDIDAVLLGPRGVIVFEVKAWTGEYLATGHDWFWRPGSHGRWEPARRNPSSQALHNVERIKRTLQRAGLRHVQVRGVVAVASPHMRVYLEPPLAVYVFYACQDDADVRWLWRTFNGRALSTDDQRRVRSALLPHLAAAMA